ncbi:hypothetical protein ACFE04_008460 [Oxalis oulophora]
MGSFISISIPCDTIFIRCWDDCVNQRASYISNLEDNLVSLEKALDELKAKRDDVMSRVYVAEHQQKLKPLNEVKFWLSNVILVENEVAELMQIGSEEIKSLCFKGCCSKTCLSSYKVGERVVKKLVDVTSLISKGEFNEVASSVGLSRVDVRPSEPTVGLESTFDSIWSCLQETEEAGIVGLHGMGGVGKTTVMKQINNKFSIAANKFDFVFWVLVSKDLNAEHIQEEVWKKIGFLDLSWKNQSCENKAIDIFRILTQKRFVLFLDDIWERIDLLKIGIPYPTLKNGCKVVFSTRSEEVCYKMKAAMIIKVECLVWEKAWELFRKKVGEETLCVHPDIPELAKTVAKECGGLPLALITTGHAMAGKKTPQEWKHAIATLKRNASKFSGMEDEVFPILKFSYENLRNDKIRSCFLYCALFPEDFYISKANLIDYWIGEGMLDQFVDRIEAVNEGYDFMGALIRANLLEDAGISVKMHDVIRDLALWLTNECGEVKDSYLVKAGAKLTEIWIDSERWERVKRMSLMSNKIDMLIQKPNCPIIQTLFLQQNYLKVIGIDFFTFMPSLRVLDLSKNRDLAELPIGISKLVSLEHLNLSETGIRQLPVGLTALTNLKYLNLEYTRQLYKIPSQWISSFSKLQVLRMYGYGANCTDEEVTLSRENELLVEELHDLKNLKMLTITVRSDYALQRFLSSKKLQSCAQSLSIHTLISLKQLKISSLRNMNCLENLSVDDCEQIEDFNMKIAPESAETQFSRNPYSSAIISNRRQFESLRSVSIVRCHKLKDLTWLCHAPNITSLVVLFCVGIEVIINAAKLGNEFSGSINLLERLENLTLRVLPELKSIYINVLPFPCLRKISVTACQKFNKLPLNSNSAMARRIVIEGEEDWWNALQWEDEAARTAFLTCFRSY